MNEDAPAAKKRVTADGEQSTQHTRERRVDSQLIFATFTNAHRLYVDRITFSDSLLPSSGDGGRELEMADSFRLIPSGGTAGGKGGGDALHCAR